MATGADWAQAASGLLPQFWIEKYKRESSKSWNLFYKREQGYKDRHWIEREFGEYIKSDACGIETGCGIGNLLFPILTQYPNVFLYACDFSPRAVEICNSHTNFNKSRCKIFVADLVNDSLSSFIPDQSLAFATMIFVLSAIPLENQLEVLLNVRNVMQPGAYLCFRDYCTGDYAQQRFASAIEPSKIATDTFVRQDGTIAHFFDPQRLETLMQLAQFDKVYMKTVEGLLTNRKRNLSISRKYLQGVFKIKSSC